MDVMKMDSPESLLTWAQACGSPIRMDTIDAGILLDCCRSKGFSIGSDSEGRLYLSGKLVSTQMDLDDVIDLVCDWLYEDKQVAKDKMEKTTDIANYSRWSMDLDCIQEMQREMNRLFEQTKYGRKIAETASKVADDVYQRLTYVPVYKIPVVDEPKVAEVHAEEKRMEKASPEILSEPMKPEMQVAEPGVYAETKPSEHLVEHRVREPLPFEPTEDMEEEVDLPPGALEYIRSLDADGKEYEMEQAHVPERRGR